jgi:hypothetical protein
LDIATSVSLNTLFGFIHTASSKVAWS